MERMTLRAQKDTDPTEQAKTIVRIAQENGVTLRVIGGLAIRLHCHGPHSQHVRDYQDIDVFGFREEVDGLRAVFEKMHYLPNRKYNMLYGATRLQFIHEESQKSVDVFLDKFIMDHTIDFRPRLRLDDLTIPITDLLLTKLQIEKLNEKDVKDIIAIVEDHELGYVNDHETLNLEYMTQLCSRDWGLHKTVTDNIRKIGTTTKTLGIEENRNLEQKLNSILNSLITAKKGLKWTIRNLIGERVKWYDEVEMGEDEV
jgi:hypothetical protein